LNEEFDIFQSIDLLSLCSRCNTRVLKIDRKSVEGKVPLKVTNHFTEFWKCPACQRYYWKGGHVIRLREKLARMKIPLPQSE
jgi:uncharacterized protein with PIN domain